MKCFVQNLPERIAVKCFHVIKTNKQTNQNKAKKPPQTKQQQQNRKPPNQKEKPPHKKKTHDFQWN